MAYELKRSRDSEPTLAGSSAVREVETNEDSWAKKTKRDNSFVLVSSMNELYSQREFLDVTIQIGQRQFRSHRLLLASLSEHFHEMFGGIYGNGIPAETVIFMDNLDALAFESILNFMYKGDIDSITDDNIIYLMETANFLRLKNPYIERKCAEYLEMCNGSRIQNAIEIFQCLRVLSNGKRVTNVVRKHICLRLDEFRNDDTFRCISYEDLKELLPPGCPSWIYNQDGALNFILGWIHYDRKNRKRYFKELIKLINMEKVSNYWISFLLTEREKSIDEFECVERIDNRPSFGGSLPLCPIGIFTYFIENFSKVGEHQEPWSPFYEYKIGDIPVRWQIHVRTYEFDGYLDFALMMCCGDYFFIGERKYPVKLRYSILAQVEGCPDITRDVQHAFTKESRIYPPAETPFARWSEVIDPNRGLIKDDTVIFQVKIVTVEDSC